MIDLCQREDGIVLPVRAQAGARRQGIVGVHAGQLKVAVNQVAERGKANVAIMDVLCDSLGLRKAQVSLLVGATSPHKQFLISGIDIMELDRRVTAQLSQGSR
ncbi:MAG: DUF167 domain-containing protein [Pirellulaceae bacterium]|nr:DUF167 domain-containing protein [Planctomycetales bacterium]